MQQMNETEGLLLEFLQALILSVVMTALVFCLFTL